MRSWVVSALVHVAAAGLVVGVGSRAVTHVQPSVKVMFQRPPVPPLPRANVGGQAAAAKPQKSAVSKGALPAPSVAQQLKPAQVTPPVESAKPLVATLEAPASMPAVKEAAPSAPAEASKAGEQTTLASTLGGSKGSSGLGQAGAATGLGGSLGKGTASQGVDWGAYTDHVSKLIAKHRRYPASALELGLEGDVEVMVVVKADGFLQGSPRVVRSSGYPSLDGEAIKMVERALPLPKVAGENNGVTLRVPVHFRLDS